MVESRVGRTKLGETNTKISKMCFGTYKLGLKTDPVSAIDLLGHAHNNGINFIDTSDNYPGAELIIGKAIQDVLPRNDLVIATKTGLAMSEYEGRDFEERGIDEDTSPERIRRRVNGSLRMMGVETIDLYQVHVYDPQVEPVEITTVMNELIEGGKIRHWGISNYNDPELVSRIVEASKAAGLIGPVSLQDGYSLIGRHCEQAIETARQLGLSIMAFSPLRKGALSEHIFTDIPTLRKEIAEADHGGKDVLKKKQELTARERLQELQRFAEKNGANIQQLAIAWLMNQEATIPILGAYKQEHFDDLIQAAEWKLDDEALALIDNVVMSAFS